MDSMIRSHRLVLGILLSVLLLPAVGQAQSREQTTATSWTELAEQLKDLRTPAATRPQAGIPTRSIGKAQAYTTYPDRAAFDAAIAGLPVEDFESPLVLPGTVNLCLSEVSWKTDDACYPAGELYPWVKYTSAHADPDTTLVTLGDGFFGSPTTTLGPNRFLDDMVLNFNPPVGAVGLDIVALSGTMGSFDVMLTDENDVTTTWSFSPGFGVPIFFGVSSPDRIKRIEINDDAYGNNTGEVINDLAYPVRPDIPVLLTPLFNAMNVPNTVDLRWAEAAFAIRYNVEVYDDAALTNRIWHANVPGKQVTFHAPMQGKTYYWRVNSEGAGGVYSKIFSDLWHFTTELVVPAPPTLLTPLNGAVDVANAVDLRWNLSQYATRYNIEVATDSEFKNKILHENVPGSPFHFVAPTQGTTYWWRVNAMGPGGSSAYSTRFHFTTIALKPGKPMLVSPADGAVDQPNELDLQWAAAANANRYDVQVFADSNMTDQVFHDNTPALTSHFVAPMAGGMYYWRVQAEGPGGSTASDLFSFSTSATGGGSLVPLALMPEDGATDVPIDPLMSWSPPQPDSAKSYWVQIAKDAAFDSLVVDEDSIDATNLQVMGLNYQTMYYWHVAGVDAGGASTFSATQSFTTVAEVVTLGPVQLVSPPDASTGVSATETLTWDALDGAEAYQVQVATDAGFTSLVADDSTLTGTSFETATPYAYSTAHYWRVRAKNAAGWGEWSTVWSFTTGAGVAVEGTGEIPTDFSVSQNYPNPFNPTTRIEYALPEASNVRITVFDALGRPVGVLVNDHMAAGYHTLTWSGTNLVSGTYYYRIEAGSFTETRQMTLLK